VCCLMVSFCIFSDNYPKDAPCVITRSEVVPQNIMSEVCNIVDNTVKANPGCPVIDKIMQEVFRLLTEKSMDCSLNVVQSSEKGKRKQKVRQHGTNKADATQKLPSMKTAKDVTNRLLWDKSLPTDSFTIGYLDRFRGILEKPFSEFSWEDIASVDFDVFTVPQHRIQYFKYQDVIVWDKRNRIDNVFGSTGSGLGIHDVIGQCDELKLEEPEPCKTDLSVENSSKNMTADSPLYINRDNGSIDLLETNAKECVEEDNPLYTNNRVNGCIDLLENNAKECVEQDNPLYTNNRVNGCIDLLENNAKECVEEEGNPLYFNNRDTGSIDFLANNIKCCVEEEWGEDKDNVWEVKQKPTHFICIRITDRNILSKVAEVQNAVLEKKPIHACCCAPPEILHVTLCTLRLTCAEHIASVCHILHSLQTKLGNTDKQLVNIAVEGIDTFLNRVVYAKIHPNESLTEIIKQITTMLHDHVPTAKSCSDFTPHMTMVKLYRDARKGPTATCFEKEDYDMFQSVCFGKQNVDAVYLCEVGGQRREDGFYITQMTASLN